MLIITLHGFGFYGVWLFTGEYTRGLVWDRTGAHQPLILPRHPLQVEASSLHAGHAWLRLYACSATPPGTSDLGILGGTQVPRLGWHISDTGCLASSRRLIGRAEGASADYTQDVRQASAAQAPTC